MKMPNVFPTRLSSHFIGDLFLVSGGRVITILFQLAFVKLYTSLFSPSDLGYYFFWQTISYSMSALVFVPLDQFQQVNLHRNRELGITLRSLIPLNATLISAVLVLGVVASAIVSVSNGTIIIAPLYAVFMAITIHLSTSLRNATNNLGFRRLAVVFSVVDGGLRVGFLFLCAKLLAMHSTGILVTTSLAGATVTLAIIPFFNKWKIWGEGKFEPPKWNDLLLFAWPIIVGAGLNWLQLQSSRFLVPLGFAAAIGTFATVSAIGQAGMQAAVNIYSMMFLPDLYKSFGRTTNRYIGWGLVMVAFVFLVSLFAAKYLVILLTNRVFVPYAYCVLFGILIEGGNFILGGLSIYIQVRRRNELGLLAGALGFAGSIVPLAGFYYMRLITPFTLGMIAVFSQAVTVLSLYIIYVHLRRTHENVTPEH